MCYCLAHMSHTPSRSLNLQWVLDPSSSGLPVDTAQTHANGSYSLAQTDVYTLLVLAFTSEMQHSKQVSDMFQSQVLGMLTDVSAQSGMVQPGVAHTLQWLSCMPVGSKAWPNPFCPQTHPTQMPRSAADFPSLGYTTHGFCATQGGTTG